MRPIVTATVVVAMYIEIVLPPILDNFFKSDSEATPVISEERTRGTAISFKRLIKIFPKGEIQFEKALKHQSLDTLKLGSLEALKP